MYEIASQTQRIPNNDPWAEVGRNFTKSFDMPLEKRVELFNSLSDKFMEQLKEHYTDQALKPKSISSKWAAQVKGIVEGAIRCGMAGRKTNSTQNKSDIISPRGLTTEYNTSKQEV